MQLKQVALLDDNSDLRELITEYFEFALKTKVLGLTNYHEMIQKLKEVLSSELVILDIELGFEQPSGYEAYKTLMQKDFKGLIIFLTGHAGDHPFVRKAKSLNCVVWEKPMTGKFMVSEIKKLIDQLKPSGAIK